MGFFNKQEKNRSINAIAVDGLECYDNDTILQLEIDNDNNYLVISSKMKSEYPNIKISFKQIKGVKAFTKQEIIQESKSVVGRAAVGGVLLGPLGAIIGGMSGIGDKTSSQSNQYIVINYKTKEDELKILSFEVVGFSIWPKFIKELESKIEKQDFNCKEIYL